MKISTVRPGTGLGAKRLLVPIDGGDAPATVSVQRGPPPAAPSVPVSGVQPGSLTTILATGAKAKAADTATALLIEQIHRATPAQVGTMLLNNHLAATPAAAQSQAERMLAAVQNREGGAILLGVRAGVGTFVVVDSLAPGWSFGRKLAVAVLAAIAVAAAVYYGTPPQPAAPPAVTPATAR